MNTLFYTLTSLQTTNNAQSFSIVLPPSYGLTTLFLNLSGLDTSYKKYVKVYATHNTQSTLIQNITSLNLNLNQTVSFVISPSSQDLTQYIYLSAVKTNTNLDTFTISLCSRPLRLSNNYKIVNSYMYNVSGANNQLKLVLELQDTKQLVDVNIPYIKL